MSYESTVIANGVDAFWRLDELADSHPILTDASGNGRHATCYADDPLNPERHIHGFQSPIETDAGSRAMSGRAGAWTDTVNRFNTFAWQGWGYNLETAGPKTILCRAGHWATTGACIMGFNSAIAARLFINGTTYDLTYNDTVFDVWYYIVVVYNAGVVQLWVNAVLRDEITGVTGDLNPQDATQFTIGSQQGPNATIQHSQGVDEVAIGPALSEAQILENYEAALNSLFIAGASNVIPTAVLYSSIDPDPIEFPFRHNWNEQLIERITFRTNISKARAGTQENSQVRPKPRREIEIAQVMRDNNERRKLRAQLWANRNRKWFIPILEDREQLTAPLSVGATVVPVSTLYKDYEVGSYLGLRQLNDAGVIVKSETLLIQSFDAVSVTVPAIANDYAAYLSSAYPVRRGLIEPSSIRGHTDAVEEVTITARLLAEDEEVVPNRITSWTPTLKYRDVEVFDPAVWQSNDWSDRREYESQRQLDEIDFDAGVFGVESDTIGAEETFTYRMVLKGREDIAAFLGWFYTRAGALNYIWVASMQQDFEILSVDGSDITVSGTNYSDNFALAEPRRDLAFVYHDNTMEFRRVTGFAGTTNETLTLGAVVPTLTNLRSLSLLKFCQLDADSLEIAKETDDVWVFAWRFRELLTTPEGTGLSSMSPSSSVSASRSHSASQSPSSSVSLSTSPSGSVSPSSSVSPSGSVSLSRSPSSSSSPSSSASLSVSPSGSTSPSSSVSPSV